MKLTTMPLASLALLALLFAGRQSVQTPQSASAPAPTPDPSTAEATGPEFPLSLTTASVVTQGEVSFESVLDGDTGRHRVILNPGAQVRRSNSRAIGLAR